MEEYIYHYTSIETLSLILKNKNIRFNSIKNVDDINETQFSAEHGIALSSYTLILCWTNNEEENLAFWNVYTPNMQGVRIKIPKNIFKKYNFVTTDKLYIGKNQYIPDSLVSEEECFNNSKYCIVPFSENFIKVEYTNDEILLKPIIYNSDNIEYSLNIGKIGRYKSKIWEFQNEVGFKLFVLPTKDLYGNQINPLNNVRKIVLDKIPAPIEIYFIPILESAFERMEITLGPKCGTPQEIIVKSLIEKYNPKAKILKNKFYGLIR